MIKTIKRTQVHLLFMLVIMAACGKDKLAKPEENVLSKENNSAKVSIDGAGREAKAANAAALYSNVEGGTLMTVTIKFGGGNAPNEGVLITLREPGKSKVYYFDVERHGGACAFGYIIDMDAVNRSWMAPASDQNNVAQTSGSLTITEFDVTKNIFKATYSVQAYNLRHDSKKVFAGGEIDVVFVNHVQ